MVYGPASPDVPLTSVSLSYPRSPQQGALRLGVGAVLVLAGVASQLLGIGFPYNAPVEQFYNFGITVALVAAGLTLIVVGIIAFLAPSVPTGARPIGTLALTAAVLTGLTVVVWLITALPAWLSHLGDLAAYRYGELNFGPFLAGVPWMLGIVFATIGLRRSERTTRIICWVCIGVGLLLLIPTLAATALYGAGLTD